MSGLFGNGFNNSNKEDFNKCNCPHCRGGHIDEVQFEQEYESEWVGQSDAQSDEVAYFDEQIDPEELIQEYVEYLLHEVESEEDVSELMIEFFNHVFKYGVEQTYITELQTKIQLLSMLKNNY